MGLVIECSSEFNYNAQLANGLKIIIHKQTGYQKKHAIFATRYGSIDNDFIDFNHTRQRLPSGIAHFLEHNILANPNRDAYSEFSALGVALKAYTSHYMTSYHISGTRNFDKAVNKLLDIVQYSCFDNECINKQQRIIEQELHMCEDSAEWVLEKNILSNLYHSHPIKNGIGGTVKSVQKISIDMLYLCYQTFYQPSNMILYLIGDIDVNQFLDLIVGNQAKKDLAYTPKITRYFPTEPLEIVESKKISEMPVVLPLYSLGIKCKPLEVDGDKLLKHEILTNVINYLIFGKSSELFNELYENGLILDDFGMGYFCNFNYGYSLIKGSTVNPNELHQRVVVGLDKVKRKGFTDTDLTRVKRMTEGWLITCYDNFYKIAEKVVSYYMKGMYFENYSEIVKNITLSDINKRLYEYLIFDRIAISTINS